jgi:subtilisin family serine protease
MHTFELYLTGDTALRQQALQQVLATYRVEATPFYRHPAPGFELFYRLNLPPSANIYDQAYELSQVPGIVEVDPVKKILGLFNQPQKGAYDSDDDYPYSDYAWNHTLTHFDKAVTKSIAAGKLNPKVGTGIRVAHLDTGVTKHPELALIKTFGYDFVDSDPDPTDPLVGLPLDNPGHGTATSSIFMGAHVPRPDDRVDGLFPYVQFVPYRIANSVIHFFASHIGEAIVRAVDEGCKIITMSMGGAPPRASWREAVRYATEKGVILCFAAGNNVDFVIWPARYPDAIAIAGVNLNGEPWEGSCFGEDVDISAPGENVYVARVEKDNTGNVYLYTFGSGTSYATPHIAAAAALWINHYADELAALSPADSVAAFRYALSKSAFQPAGWDARNFGSGILNAEALLGIGPADYLQSGASQALLQLRANPRDADTPSVRQKEMWDLLLNNEATTVAELEKHIRENGSATAKANFAKIKTQFRSTLQRRELFGDRLPAGSKIYQRILRAYADAVIPSIR